MSQIPSTSVQVCQLTPNYIFEKYAHTTYNFFRSIPSCACRACIGSLLTNFAQQDKLSNDDFTKYRPIFILHHKQINITRKGLNT